MSDSEPIDMAGLRAENADLIRVNADLRRQVRNQTRMRADSEAEVERLKKDIDTLTHENATTGLLNYIAEKQEFESEATTYIHELQSEVARLTAVVQGVREIAERECDCAGFHTCDSEEILSVLAGGTDTPKGCVCGEGEVIGDSTPGPCYIDAAGFTVHRPAAPKDADLAGGEKP